MDTNILLSILIGYLLGSIPFTQIVAKAVKGIDLREVGSRNVGGRNLSRSVGFGWGIFAGSMDALKGFLAMATASALGVPYPLAYYAGMAAVAGHNWSVWLQFRGGKGLATALGATLWVFPGITLLTFFFAVLILLRTKNITLTAIGGFSSLFILIEVFNRPNEESLFVLGLLIVVMLASYPDILHKLHLSGGVREYMRDPNKVYELEAKAREKKR